MSILDFFSRRRSTAPVARERLQVLLAHERAFGGADLAAVLKQEILEVIARHIPIDRDRVMVKLDRGHQVSTLEIDVEMPDTALAEATIAPAPARRRRTARAASPQT